MCDICTKAVHGVALWTRVTLGLDMCDICTEAVHGVAIWTRVTLGLDMCDLCTEAVHGVAIWTRVTLGLDMCDIYIYTMQYIINWTKKWWIPQRRYWRREHRLGTGHWADLLQGNQISLLWTQWMLGWTQECCTRSGVVRVYVALLVLVVVVVVLLVFVLLFFFSFVVVLLLLVLVAVVVGKWILHEKTYPSALTQSRWFKVTLWPPIWRSLSLWNGHLTIPKRSQGSYYLDQESPLLHVIQIHPLQSLIVSVWSGTIRP